MARILQKGTLIICQEPPDYIPKHACVIQGEFGWSEVDGEEAI